MRWWWGKNGPKLTPGAERHSDPVDPEEMKKKLQAQAKQRMEEMKANMAAGTPVGSSSRMSRPNINMGEVAAYLAGLLHKPVMDMTGLDGKYAIELEIQSAPG